jgi:hypothetical protein
LFPTIEDEELLRFFAYPGYIKGKPVYNAVYFSSFNGRFPSLSFALVS